MLAGLLLRHFALAELAGVLAGFGGAVQRFDSAGDDELHRPGIDIKGRWTLGGIERAEATAGSSADVDQAASLFQSFRDQIDCAGDLRQGSFHGSGNFGVLRIDDVGDFERGFQVEISGGAVGLLCREVAQFRGGLLRDTSQQFASVVPATHFMAPKSLGHN